MLKEICFFFLPRIYLIPKDMSLMKYNGFLKREKTTFKYFEGYFTRFYSTNLGPTKITKTPV